MAWLVLGLFAFGAAFAGAWAFTNADPKALAKVLRYVGGGLLGAVALFLFLTGRVGLALPAAAGAAWLLGRRFPFSVPGLGGLSGSNRKSSGQTSEVETGFIAMTLDHDTGEMSGTVRKGRFARTALEDLDKDDLVDLLKELEERDEEGARLLEAYLDRRFGEAWYDDREAGGPDPSEGARGAGGGARAGRGMSREEALDVLGLEEGADEDAIRAAYRGLMQKLHPDHGGSAYLAARLNEARDVLLRS